MKTCILIPTYNERINIEKLLPQLLELEGEPSILVIDDNSPDGTGDYMATVASRDPRVRVIHRPGKLGLGTAYTRGLSEALALGFTHMVTMDADFSHSPGDVPRLVEGAKDRELVIGSRYVRGGHTRNWGFHRRLLSRIANMVAGPVVGGGVKDATAGFRCYRSSLLGRIPLHTITSNGYAFQVEMVYEARRAGAEIREIPIEFIDREEGRSKMSAGIILEAAKLLFRILRERAVGRRR